MSFYQKISAVGLKFFSKGSLFKHGFNYSPMYRRTTGRITHATDDLLEIRMKLPINWKNRNYVNTIFGGSMFSSVDPIPMVQLMNILGKDYVVWDKSAQIDFKRPAKVDLYATFSYSPEEIAEIKNRVANDHEIEITKETRLMDREGEKEYCRVKKQIYVADKNFFKEKKSRNKKA